MTAGIESEDGQVTAIAGLAMALLEGIGRLDFQDRIMSALKRQVAFDASLGSRNPAWGLRDTDAVKGAAADAGLAFAERRAMPANNLMLLFRRT